MATITAQEPEKSLWDRVSETSADIANKALLVRRGIAQSVAGIPAIPAYIVDLGNMGVKKLGATGYEGSAGAWVQGKVMQGVDAVDLNILKPTIKNETDQKWADYTEIGADVAMTIGTLGAGSVKLAGTGAKLATKTAAKEAAQVAEETAKAATKVTVEDTSSILAKAKAAGEAERAGVKVAAETTETAAETGAKAGVTGTNSAAKAEYGYSEVVKIVKREKDLAGRLESLTGHGPKADAMTDRLIAGARKTGVSGDDWAAIKNSRSLPQSVIDRVGKIRDDYVSSPWGVGPAWEKAKGTAAYWKAYPGESAVRAVAAPVTIPFKMAAEAVTHHKGKALLLGTGVAAYYGVNTLADSPDPAAAKNSTEKPTPPVAGEKTEPAAPSRDVPIEETLAKNATDTAIFISKLSMTSALTMALNAASQIPGLGTVALNSARGSAQSLVQEIADGEPDINKAWDISQGKLNQILPGAHLTALGEFVKGKGIEDMSEEDRTRVSDALTAITQPHSEKARTFRGTIVAEAKQKAEQAGQYAGLSGGGVASALNAAGADFDMDDGMKDMLGEFLGIDPKNLNARNMARMMRDFAGDNKLALGLGMYAAYTTDGGPLKKAVAGLVTTMVMSFMMPHLMQMFGPMLSAAGPALTNMRDQLGEKFDQASTTGQFNTNAHGLTAPDAVPVQKQTAPAANDPVASFRDNGSMMTNPVADTRKVVVNPAIPAANRDQYALTMNG